MQSPQSPQSPGSPRNCFCGSLASPYRDNKYCSKRCAQVDTEKMLTGQASHYRNVSQTETLERLVRSDSRCRVAKEILVEANVVCDTRCGQPNVFKPLPPLPPQSQLPSPRAIADVKNNLNFQKQEGTLLPRPLLKRLQTSVLARRTEQRAI